MGNRPKKKVILILVEGETDQIALGNSLSELYYKRDPDYIVLLARMDYDGNQKHIYGGDITTKNWITENNIEKKIYKRMIEPALAKYKVYLYPKDLCRIIHIVDLDGAYIPDKAIVESDQAKQGFIYTDAGILVKDKALAIERNEHKRTILNKLRGLKEIKVKSKSIPYSLFFFSSNLDHFLHRDPNLSPEDKRRLTNSFNDNCIFDINYFIDTFCNDSDAVDMSLKDSWIFITEGVESIRRHTNVNILINGILEGKMD